jgi:hypothetical protein
VNFHTKNPIMPMRATPPATDIPIMEPVLRPELPLEALLVDDEAAEEVLDDVSDVSVCVRVCVPTAGVVVKPLDEGEFGGLDVEGAVLVGAAVV